VNAVDKLVRLLPRLTEEALTFRRHDAFPGLPTINVGVIKGGTLPSMLADRAEAGIDVRTVPGMTPETVLADFTNVLAQARKDDPALDAEIVLSPRPVFCQELPFHIDPESPVIRFVARARESYGTQTVDWNVDAPSLFRNGRVSHSRRGNTDRHLWSRQGY
jgi:acetylornithine deacetylase/succinyl-diaminopimelate desuccinylase-like protein